MFDPPNEFEGIPSENNNNINPCLFCTYNDIFERMNEKKILIHFHLWFIKHTWSNDHDHYKHHCCSFLLSLILYNECFSFSFSIIHCHHIHLCFFFIFIQIYYLILIIIIGIELNEIENEYICLFVVFGFIWNIFKLYHYFFFFICLFLCRFDKLIWFGFEKTKQKKKHFHCFNYEIFESKNKYTCCCYSHCKYDTQVKWSIFLFDSFYSDHGWLKFLISM